MGAATRYAFSSESTPSAGRRTARRPSWSNTRRPSWSTRRPFPSVTRGSAAASAVLAVEASSTAAAKAPPEPRHERFVDICAALTPGACSSDGETYDDVLSSRSIPARLIRYARGWSAREPPSCSAATKSSLHTSESGRSVSSASSTRASQSAGARDASCCSESGHASTCANEASPSTISAACTPSAHAVATAFRCESVDATSTDCIPPPFSSQCSEETHHAASVLVHAETAVMFACGRSIEWDSPSSAIRYVGGSRWRVGTLPSAAESSVV